MLVVGQLGAIHPGIKLWHRRDGMNTGWVGFFSSFVFKHKPTSTRTPGQLFEPDCRAFPTKTAQILLRNPAFLRLVCEEVKLLPDQHPIHEWKVFEVNRRRHCPDFLHYYYFFLFSDKQEVIVRCGSVFLINETQTEKMGSTSFFF